MDVDSAGVVDDNTGKSHKAALNSFYGGAEIRNRRQGEYLPCRRRLEVCTESKNKAYDKSDRFFLCRN